MSPHGPSLPPSGDGMHRDPEVRAYLKRLLAAIGLGLLVVIISAVWAWNEYGGKMKDRPPLPVYKQSAPLTAPPSGGE